MHEGMGDPTFDGRGDNSALETSGRRRPGDATVSGSHGDVGRVPAVEREMRGTTWTTNWGSDMEVSV